MQRRSRPEVCISARQLGQSKRGTAARFLQVSQQPLCISTAAQGKGCLCGSCL